MLSLLIWLVVAFVVSLLAALLFGVRGAISSFMIGAAVAVAPNVASLVGTILSSADDSRPMGFGWINATAFRTAYWWMMAFPASAVGLAVRSWRLRHRASKDVF